MKERKDTRRASYCTRGRRDCEYRWRDFELLYLQYDLLHNERTVLWSKPVSELRQVKRYRHISLSLYDRRFGSTRCLSDKTIHVIYAKVAATYHRYRFWTCTHSFCNAHICTHACTHACTPVRRTFIHTLCLARFQSHSFPL